MKSKGEKRSKLRGNFFFFHKIQKRKKVLVWGEARSKQDFLCWLKKKSLVSKWAAGRRAGGSKDNGRGGRWMRPGRRRL